MAKRYEVRTEAERHIHNDLANCAFDFQERMHRQLKDKNSEGLYHTMLASLVFSAFSIESRVNFVGWKKLESGWPERANLREKVELLLKVLSIDLDWAERPLQTIVRLNRFRNTVAHGKPDIVDDTQVRDVEPEIWDALRSQWERDVIPEFVDVCREDDDAFWHRLLKAAEIPVTDTTTRAHQSFKSLVEGNNA